MSLMLSACPGNGRGLDANGNPLLPDGSGGGPLMADFASIQANLFTPICTACHIGATAPQGLRLDAANSYNLLVGVPSTEVPSVLRVHTGDAVNSYLIQKLEGHASVGARMPFGGPYLSDEQIAVIAQWISDGALRPAAAVVQTAQAFATSTPAAHETLAAPPQLMLSFIRDLDLTRLDADAVRIEQLAAADSMGSKIPGHFTVPAGNSRALLFWPARPLSSGRYRVTIGDAIAEGAPDRPDAWFEFEVSP